MSSSSVSNAATCCKCKEVRRYHPAIFICKKGHNICEVCKPTAKKCPVNKCSYNKTPLRNEALEKLVRENVEFECRYKYIHEKFLALSGNGCNIELVLDKLPQHESVCEWRLVICTNKGCDQRMIFKMLNKHIFEECTKRLVPCLEDGCYEKVSVDELQMHRERCNFRIVPCPEARCIEMIAANALQGHRSSCAFRMVKCSENLCYKEIVFNDLQNHLDICDYRKVTCDECSASMPAFTLAHHQVSKCPSRLIPCPYPWCTEDSVKRGAILTHLTTHGDNVKWNNQNPAAFTFSSKLGISWMEKKYPLVALSFTDELYFMNVYCSGGHLYVWVSGDESITTRRCKITLEGNGNRISIITNVFKLDELRRNIIKHRNCIQLSSRGLEPLLETNDDGYIKVTFTLALNFADDVSSSSESSTTIYSNSSSSSDESD